MKWPSRSIFYHIYPLGACGAPKENDYSAPSINRLKKIEGWIDHMRSLNMNALYLGPVFESGTHGYDTTDYFKVDRRLGDNQTLKQLVNLCHDNGIRIVLDAVLNHCGRDFFAFKDLRENGKNSPYRNWFSGIDFDEHNNLGDPFTYNTWDGHHDLVKFNLENEEVVRCLLDAVKKWVSEFDIDGLRIDAADVMSHSFLRKLRSRACSLKENFWLLGEVVHGDYNDWVNDSMLHSVTNYEVYKGLYSSHNDENYFEISYSLNRQFGEEGCYRGKLLYNFADNHDVDRVASSLGNPRHLYPLYILLFTIPGIPSIYYGSEYGIEGKRDALSDSMLRPELSLGEVYQTAENSHVIHTIRKLAGIRRAHPGLQMGEYRPLHTDHTSFAFLRSCNNENVLVAVNAEEERKTIQIAVPLKNGMFVDHLNDMKQYSFNQGRLTLELYPHWGVVMVQSSDSQ
jgi:cyclomaltodextrinase / maltogenic alpha-amylase / neopullulanase